METKRQKSIFSRFPATKLLFLGVFALLTLNCNDYPVEEFPVVPFVQVTDVLEIQKSKKVDILFVIDSSQSMENEQKKLARNFPAFIDTFVNLSGDRVDFQIGIITPDLEQGKGRLLGTPKLLRYTANRSKQSVVEAFRKNSQVGILGTGYEKGLESMKVALSKDMLEGPNKGFLRPGAALAIIFVSDEDDCTHDGSIKESQEDPIVCYNKRFNNLIPTSKYINFLKSLNRRIIVSGIIGNPMLLDKKEPVRACQDAAQCTDSSGEKHVCDLIKKDTRQCGGCWEAGAKDPARAGFRYYDLIKAFPGPRGPQSHWYSICGDDKGFQEALFRFAQGIAEMPSFITLSAKTTYQPGMRVEILKDGGSVQAIAQAKPLTPAKACTPQSNQCGQSRACAPYKGKYQCYGDGWVYVPSNVKGGKNRLQLSGKAKDLVQPGIKLRVVFTTE